MSWHQFVESKLLSPPCRANPLDFAIPSPHHRTRTVERSKVCRIRPTSNPKKFLHFPASLAYLSSSNLVSQPPSHHCRLIPPYSPFRFLFRVEAEMPYRLSSGCHDADGSLSM
ncbi:hypothetical protein BJ508DRAFT_416196 [Ascobolus immersus RN42]|uniref:Uncharacterized protein n=1 Tax=Ascobolus immersus RN42 TaxID=1160509 RepID=A0A3N4HZ19_ASCIM|nr:hypothetical protein BJ508DRAFT_416196 [Ascobolus immersus RN42]